MIIITLDVFCDSCPNWIFGNYCSPNLGEGRAIAKQTALAQGWMSMDGKFICPDCQKKLTKQEG